MAPLCMQNFKCKTQMQAGKIQCETNRRNSNPYKIQTFTKWVTSKAPLHTEKKKKKKRESFWNEIERKRNNKLTDFHLFSHFWNEVGVEWNEAKWVAIGVDETNEFLTIDKFRHLGIWNCISKKKKTKQLLDIAYLLTNNAFLYSKYCLVKEIVGQFPSIKKHSFSRKTIV